MACAVGPAQGRYSSEVQKYILSKVEVSCEGEQAEKMRRVIPPPDLPHPPWDNPTSFESRDRARLNPATEFSKSRTEYEVLHVIKEMAPLIVAIILIGRVEIA